MYIMIESSLTFAYDYKENNLRNVHLVILGNFRIFFDKVPSVFRFLL